MNKLRLILILLALVGFVSLFYFFYNRSSASSRQEDNSVSGSVQNTEHFKEEKGKTIIDMPAIPLYPDANIEKSQKAKAVKDITYIITMKTTQSLYNFVTFYETELTKNGWKIINQFGTKEQTEGEAEGSIEATLGNMNLNINYEREDTNEPLEIILSLYIKNK